MKKILIILAVCLVACVAVKAALPAGADVFVDDVQERANSVPGDTVSLDDYEDAYVSAGDTVGKTRKNTAKGLNALDYILERRYLDYGETFTKRWDDHLFLEAGAGLEQMVPVGNDYHFDPLTAVHVGIGKQFNRLHSLRLTANGYVGYQHTKDYFFYKAGGKLDHLFSLSSYTSGYNPSRLLDVSTIVGVGAQYAKLGRGGRSGMAAEAHVGLQLRFFTGPQGYLNIEPYCGISTDKMDLSENRNWRQYDVFYGANLNFIYYIHNNLSPESRLRFMRKRTADNYLAKDSSLQSWRKPWFFEFSNGLSFIDSPGLSFGETLGHSMAISVGKWFSPVIGARLTAESTTSTWQHDVTPEQASPYRPEYTRNHHAFFFGVRGEALINPLGFLDNYNWDSRFGFYLLAGGGLERIMKYQAVKHLACRTEIYTGGAHFWARLTDGLQVFIEPRYTHYIYKMPYSNVDWLERFSEDGFALNVGLTVSTRGLRFRVDDASGTIGELADDKMRHFAVGIGGGMNLVQAKGSYSSGAGLPANAQAFGEYHFDRFSALRLSLDFVTLSRARFTKYIDYNMSNAAAGYTPVNRTGLWDHRYFFGFASLDYMLNITNLCNGYRPGRLFELSVFLGPTCAVLFGENAKLDDSERLQENHECRQSDPLTSMTRFAGNAGLKLAANVSPSMSVVFTPTFYVIGDMGLGRTDFFKLKYIEVLNLGIQYKF